MLVLFRGGLNLKIIHSFVPTRDNDHIFVYSYYLKIFIVLPTIFTLIETDKHNWERQYDYACDCKS